MVRQYGLGVRNHDEVAARIEQVDGNIATSPMTHDGALFSGPTGSVGAVVKGIEPQRARKVLGLVEYIRGDAFDALEKGSSDGVAGVILGVNWRAVSGQARGIVSLLSLRTEKGADWRGVVVALIRSLFEFWASSRRAFTNMIPEWYSWHWTQQSFFGRGQMVTGIEVRVDAPMEAGTVAERIRKSLGSDAFGVYDWRVQNQNLFKSLTYRIAIIVVLSVMVILAACNVACLLIMLVLERTRDIAILAGNGCRAG